MAFGGRSRKGGAGVVIVIRHEIGDLQGTTKGRCYRNRLSFEEGFQLLMHEILQNACNVGSTLPGLSDLLEVLHNEGFLVQRATKLFLCDTYARPSLDCGEKVNRSGRKNRLYQGDGAVTEGVKFTPRCKIIHDVFRGTRAELNTNVIYEFIMQSGGERYSFTLT